MTLSLDVSRETIERLERLHALLLKWNPAINLVSRATLDTAWTRHILDSAQIFRLGHPHGRWVDLGSGGGFPGLVVACMAEGEGVDLSVTLIESDQRKATFLRQAARELAPKTTVLAERIEKANPQMADTLSARALADLPALLGFANRHLASGGIALFPKGERWQQEVAEARKDWHFDLTVHPSATESGGAILAVKDLHHA